MPGLASFLLSIEVSTEPSSVDHQEGAGQAEQETTAGLSQRPCLPHPSPHPLLEEGTYRTILFNKEGSGPESTCFYGYRSMPPEASDLVING